MIFHTVGDLCIIPNWTFYDINLILKIYWRWILPVTILLIMPKMPRNSHSSPEFLMSSIPTVLGLITRLDPSISRKGWSHIIQEKLLQLTRTQKLWKDNRCSWGRNKYPVTLSWDHHGIGTVSAPNHNYSLTFKNHIHIFVAVFKWNALHNIFSSYVCIQLYMAFHFSKPLILELNDHL